MSVETRHNPSRAEMTDCETLRACKSIRIMTTVSNVGSRAGYEVVLARFSPHDIPRREPASRLKTQLFEFERIHLDPDEATTVSFEVSTQTFQVFDSSGKATVFPGNYSIGVGNGGSQFLQLPLSVSSDAVMTLYNQAVTGAASAGS